MLNQKLVSASSAESFSYYRVKLSLLCFICFILFEMQLFLVWNFSDAVNSWALLLNKNVLRILKLSKSYGILIKKSLYLDHVSEKQVMLNLRLIDSQSSTKDSRFSFRLLILRCTTENRFSVKSQNSHWNCLVKYNLGQRERHCCE